MDIFIYQHFPEMAASVTGLINLWLVTRGSQWNWPFGMVTVSLYFFIFLKVSLFANMALQLVFLSLQIYGLFQWRRKRTGEHILIVRSLTGKQRWKTLIFTLLLYALTGFILQQYTHSTMIWLDSAVTAMSLSAQWLMARRYLEHWWIWMMVDAAAVGLYFQKSLYFSSGLYMIYFVFCIQGLILWKKYLCMASPPSKSMGVRQ